MKYVMSFLMAAAIAVAVSACGENEARTDRAQQGASQAAASEHQMTAARPYVCPMHPNVRAGTAEDCPICGMTLVHQDSLAAGMDHVSVFTCPHHPDHQQHEPGTCPACGMTLVEKGVSVQDSSHMEHMHGSRGMEGTE